MNPALHELEFDFSLLNRSSVCGAVNVLFESNGQSLKLGEIKFGENCQVCKIFSETGNI